MRGGGSDPTIAPVAEVEVTPVAVWVAKQKVLVEHVFVGDVVPAAGLVPGVELAPLVELVPKSG